MSLIISFDNDGKSYGTLACVMGDGIGGEADAAFTGNLLHDGSFSDSGRTDQKDGTLADGGHKILSVGILSGVDLYGMQNFFFGFFDIHNMTLSAEIQDFSVSRYNLTAHAGTFWCRAFSL